MKGICSPVQMMRDTDTNTAYTIVTHVDTVGMNMESTTALGDTIEDNVNNASD